MAPSPPSDADGDGIVLKGVSPEAQHAPPPLRRIDTSTGASSSLSLPAPRNVPPPRDATYFYSSLVAGVISGGIASVLCAPLDLIRVRMQVWGQVVGEQIGDTKAATTQRLSWKPTSSLSVPIGKLLREIRDKEGYRGFFKGLGATLLTVPVFWAIYFPCYDEFKHVWHARNPDAPHALVHLGSAVAAGAISDIVCNPMFVVRTRLQTDALHHQLADHQSVRSGPSISQTIRSLLAEGGYPVFWRGMTANLLGLSHVAIQFPLYERLKHVLQDHHNDSRIEPSAWDLLLASSSSKMLASLVSYPHEVIRSRMMDARRSHGMGFQAACQSIWRTEGWKGFYSGLPITLLRVIPNTCVTFVSYELLLRWARQQLHKS